MSDLQAIIDQLTEALDTNDAQRLALIDEAARMHAALEALGVHRPLQAAPLAAPAPVEMRPKPTETKPLSRAEALAEVPAGTKRPGTSATMRQRAAVKVVCPDCGQEVSQQGLGSHRAWHKKRPGSALAVATPAVPPPAPAPRATDDKVLACSECDATFLVIEAKALAQHTIKAHKRGPLPAERTPVAA